MWGLYLFILTNNSANVIQNKKLFFYIYTCITQIVTLQSQTVPD